MNGFWLAHEVKQKIGGVFHSQKSSTLDNATSTHNLIPQEHKEKVATPYNNHGDEASSFHKPPENHNHDEI